MKQKYHIAIRFLLLVFIGSGIFISSFHYHSDLEWNHTAKSCETGTHLTDYNSYCPVCGFRLKTVFVAPPAFELIETVTETAVLLNEPQQIDPFTGRQTGRSPPSLI